MYFMRRATSLSHCRLNMHAGHACKTLNHECMLDDSANNVIGRLENERRTLFWKSQNCKKFFVGIPTKHVENQSLQQSLTKRDVMMHAISSESLRANYSAAISVDNSDDLLSFITHA